MRQHISAPCAGHRALAAAMQATARQGRPPRTEVEHLTLPEAARLSGISLRTIFHARAVLEHGIEALVDRVREGNLAVSLAASVAKLPKADQAAMLRTLDKHRRRGVEMIYLAIDGDRMKIGISKLPAVRLTSHRTTMPNARLVAQWPGDRRKEEALKQHLAAFSIGGEVFHLTSASLDACFSFMDRRDAAMPCNPTPEPRRRSRRLVAR